MSAQLPSGIQPDAEVDPKTEVKDEPNPEDKADAKPDAKVASKLKAEVEPKPDANAEPEPEAKAKPEAKAEPQPGPGTKTRADVTPRLVKRVHELYEQLGREDVRAVQDWENAQREIQHEKPEPESHK